MRKREPMRAQMSEEASGILDMIIQQQDTDG